MDVRSILDPARFVLRSELGSGGMGVVYRVHDAERDEDVALKILQHVDADDSNRRYLLKREFRALEDIRHPNLVDLHELFALQDPPFFTMDLIDGVPLVTFLRRLGPPQEIFRPTSLQKLIHLFRQLVAGVTALHDHDKLHCDIKPPNALVTSDQRLVLLDFGLVAHLPNGRAHMDEDRTGGTLAYMAPERAFNQPPATASDWYSVGIVLYECLTGVLPYTGSAAEVLQAKRRSSRDPGEIAIDVPRALADVTRRLLDPSPSSRAGGAELLAALDSLDHPTMRRGAAPNRPHRQPGHFVGRGAEIRALEASRAEVTPGRPSIVHVVGPSGIGKSELVRRYLSDRTAPSAISLCGRCHPKESVPYKAFDEVIDDLTRHLVRLGDHVVEPLVPSHAGALMRLFPVLGRVPALRRLEDGATDLEPQEIRRQGFRACRELFQRIADRFALTIWIDDLQWGDLDSIPLLAELVSGPDAPALQLVLSYRTEDEGTSPVLKALDQELRSDGILDARRVLVGPLTEPEVHALVYVLLEGAVPSIPAVAGAELIAREADGSPFFVAELVRRLKTCPQDADLQLRTRLDDLVASRIQQLDGPAFRLLEIVSVAGSPVDRGVALDASGLGKSGRSAVHALIGENLLRETTVGDVPAVVPYHDRIRESVLESIGTDRRQDCHRRLAEALLTKPDTDPSVVVGHLVGAGDARRAVPYARRAAELAERALAFERAARLYEFLITAEPEQALDLYEKRATALATAGRSAEAGPAFEATVREAELHATSPLQIVSLRRRAAEQYLHAGMIAKGGALMEHVLHDLGFEGMTTSAAALGPALRGRLWATLRWFLWGTPVSLRPEDAVPRETLEGLDALWAATLSMTLVNHMVADVLGVRFLLRALAIGEPSRVGRALSYEATHEAKLHRSFRNRAHSLMARSADFCVRAGNKPEDRARNLTCWAAIHWMYAEWQRCVETAEQAIHTHRNECLGTTYEIAQCHSYLMSGLGYRGELRRLAAVAEEAHRDAVARGDRFAASVCVLGIPALGKLAGGDPGRVLREGDEMIETWTRTNEFHLQHYLHLVSAIPAHLYGTRSREGDGSEAPSAWRAWERITSAWTPLKQGYYLMMEFTGCELRELRGRAGVAVLATTPPSRDIPNWSRARLHQDVAEQIRDIRAKSRLPTTEPFASCLEAGLASLEQDRAREAAAWERMAQSSLAAGMALHHHAARMRLAELLPDHQARDVRQTSAGWMTAQGVRNPPALLDALAPRAVSS